MKDHFDLRGAKSPKDVPEILESIADVYEQDSYELEYYHQTKDVGSIWRRFAKILERAAKSCRKELKRKGY